MYLLGRFQERSEKLSSPTKTHEKLKRRSTFRSLEVFKAWAKDSFLNESTIDALITIHEVDCLPAALALKKEDISKLALPLGQQRLFEDAVEKLHQEYEFFRPPTPKTTISFDAPAYKSLLGIEGEEPPLRGVGEVSDESLRTSPSIGDRSSPPGYGAPFSAVFERETILEREALLKLEGKKYAQSSEQSAEMSGGAALEKDVDESFYGCACQRWMFVMITMPLLLVFAILGAISILLLLPFMVCFQQVPVEFVQKNVLFAPVNACRWAAGRRPHSDCYDSKPSYGGTADAELGGKVQPE